MTYIMFDLTTHAWLSVVIFKVIINNSLLKAIVPFSDMEQEKCQHINNQ